MPVEKFASCLEMKKDEDAVRAFAEKLGKPISAAKHIALQGGLNTAHLLYQFFTSELDGAVTFEKLFSTALDGAS
jgi:hypothetical protein